MTDAAAKVELARKALAEAEAALAAAQAEASVVETEPAVVEPETPVVEPVETPSATSESATSASPTAPLTAAQVDAIRAGYAFDGPALDMGALVNGGPLADVPVRIPLAMVNRHGLVAGATGTGKTKTLQVLAEQLSAAGVPVFAADIKGDLSGIASPGTPSDKLLERTKSIGQDWHPTSSPTEYYTLGGQGTGIPIRATISSFGPLLLSKVLGLNATQESSLGLVFHYADQAGLPLVDLSDLRIDRLESEIRHLRATSGVKLDYGDFSAEVTGDSGDEHADGASANDNNAVALRELRPAHVMNGDGDGFRERSSLERQVSRKRDEQIGGNAPQLLKRAGGVDAHEDKVLTDVLVASQARGAGAIPLERHHRDGVAHGPTRDALAERGNGAAHLVTEGEWSLDPRIH